MFHQTLYNNPNKSFQTASHSNIIPNNPVSHASLQQWQQSTQVQGQTQAVPHFQHQLTGFTPSKTFVSSNQQCVIPLNNHPSQHLLNEPQYLQLNMCPQSTATVYRLPDPISPNTHSQQLLQSSNHSEMSGHMKDPWLEHCITYTQPTVLMFSKYNVKVVFVRPSSYTSRYQFESLTLKEFQQAG